MAGTPYCNPPEFFAGNKTTGEDQDKWSVALVLYRIVEGSVAFKNIEEIMNCGLHPSKRFTPNLWNFLTTMLDKNPKKRLDGEELISHSWISQRSGN